LRCWRGPLKAGDPEVGFGVHSEFIGAESEHAARALARSSGVDGLSIVAGLGDLDSRRGRLVP
jgi:hypothetical protein